jgi:hypothetical protein
MMLITLISAKLLVRKKFIMSSHTPISSSREIAHLLVCKVEPLMKIFWAKKEDGCGHLSLFSQTKSWTKNHLGVLLQSTTQMHILQILPGVE